MGAEGAGEREFRYTFDFGLWDFFMSFAFINRSHDKIL